MRVLIKIIPNRTLLGREHKLLNIDVGKFAEIESEKVELKTRIAELLRQAVEESKRRDVKNAKLRARIKELEKNKTVTTKLESENAEFRDRITKVEQRQMQNDNVTKVTNSSNNSNNSSSNFNSMDKEMDISLPEEPIPEKVEQDLICELLEFIRCHDSTSLPNSISSKHIPDVPVDANLTPGSVPYLARLFDKAEKTGQKEKLRWYYYSEEYEKKVVTLSSENNISNQMARTQIYDEMELNRNR
ncbi:unnamed protein product [Rhizophagus irregularis]|uniref:Uncharacterized protein n=1 Tax=Rhizophagus irregularis TaxID=588596 RepID=A0A916EMC2_9GLOM|nr:unnamed protein product [Rhizophagus irregularis]